MNFWTAVPHSLNVPLRDCLQIVGKVVKVVVDVLLVSLGKISFFSFLILIPNSLCLYYLQFISGSIISYDYVLVFVRGQFRYCT